MPGFVVRVWWVKYDDPIVGYGVEVKGVGWMTKDGAVSDDRRLAWVYASEAEAWEHLCASGQMGSDEEGEYAWVEPA